jgi:diguanylate cyclase (GGDEF)-like protein
VTREERKLLALFESLKVDETSRRLLASALRLAGARRGSVAVFDPGGRERVTAERGAAKQPRPAQSVELALANGSARVGRLRLEPSKPLPAPRRAALRELARLGARALAHACAYEAALRRADLDPLTGLANHGRLWSSLEHELSRALRYGRSLSFVMLDVDGLKRLNDRAGHLAGDAALARVAKLVAERSRASDTAARYGGDEFALVLPETSRPGAAAVAEKIRAAVAAERGFAIPLHVSAGVASLPEDGRDAAELIRSADARLYQAKLAGGNRIASGD